MLLFTGTERVRKNYNGSEEMESTERSIAGATAIYLWLTPSRCSPAAYMDITSNETLA